MEHDERAVQVAPELLIRPTPQWTTLGHALNLFAGSALRYRDRFGITAPGMGVDRGPAPRRLAPPHPRRS
jgi:hypothetical protein